MKIRYLKNVVTLSLNAEKCTGCGMCVNVCPHGVFEMTERVARIVDLEACMECGACARNCAFSAVSVNSGVGCANAIINGILTGTEPSCDCSDGESCC